MKSILPGITACLNLLILGLACPSALAAPASSAIQVIPLLQTERSWEGTPYVHYPEGQPQLTVLKISIAPNTTMDWHRHPMPNAAYVLSGKLILHKREGNVAKVFTAGEAIPETVDILHRGQTGKEGVVLIVFYAGAKGLPLSKP